MTSLTKIKKNIILLPKHLNSKLRDTILTELKTTYENRCVDEYGFILSIEDILEIDNIINKDSIHITFMITFNAFIFKPLKDMIISFIPNLIVEDKGVFGDIYEHIHIFIPIEDLIENNYLFIQETFKNDENTIDMDTEIKVKISEIKYDLLKYNCVTKIV
jgi:DNA-directed RNA polymerase subunit E'/Rpb7